jgi:NitT/TauT family transport system permease protein
MKKINSIKEYKANKRREKTKIIIIQFTLLISLLLSWELLTKYEILNSFFLSSPSKIISLLNQYIENNELFLHVFKTTFEALVSLLISLSGGIICATLLFLSPFASKILDPFLVLLNALPKSAIAPILIIWLGTGTKGVIGVSISFVLILTIINVLNHFNHVDKSLITMLKSMNASKIQILTKVVFPSNIINIISTIKIALGLSFVGVIVGEFLSSRDGLGYLIMYGGQVFKLDLVMMGIFILSIIAFSFYGLIVLIERLLKKKYSLETK